MLGSMKRAILFVVVPLAFLVASVCAVSFLLPTSQLRSTLTQKAIAAPEIPVDPATMREELAKGFELGILDRFAKLSDDEILNVEEFLAKPGSHLLQDSIAKARNKVDELDALALTDDECRILFEKTLHDEIRRRGLVDRNQTQNKVVKRFATVEKYFSDGNPNPLSHRRGLPNYERDVSEKTKKEVKKRDGNCCLVCGST